MKFREPAIYVVSFGARSKFDWNELFWIRFPVETGLWVEFYEEIIAVNQS